MENVEDGKTIPNQQGKVLTNELEELLENGRMQKRRTAEALQEYTHQHANKNYLV